MTPRPGTTPTPASAATAHSRHRLRHWRWHRGAAELIDREDEVIGIGRNATALEMARKSFAEEGLANARFVYVATLALRLARGGAVVAIEIERLFWGVTRTDVFRRLSYPITPAQRRAHSHGRAAECHA